MSTARTDLSVGSIAAYRVPGADATALAPGFIPILLDLSALGDLQQTPAMVAGKKVVKTTIGPPSDDPSQPTLYEYPNDDVVWTVSPPSRHSARSSASSRRTAREPSGRSRPRAARCRASIRVQR